MADKEIDEEVEKLRKQYAHDPKAVESIASPAYRRHLQSLLLNRNILEKLKEWNIKQPV